MSLAFILSKSVYILGDVVSWLIMARILFNIVFMMGSRGGFVYKLYDMLCQLTDPILVPIQRMMSRITKGPVMFDFSPLIAWLLIDYIIVPVLQRLINFIFI